MIRGKTFILTVFNYIDMSYLKVLKGRWFLVLFIFATLPFSSPATPLSSYDLCATPLVNADPDPLTNNEWRIYDVNGDGKFDVTDIDEFVGGGGIGFVNDLNSDGDDASNQTLSERRAQAVVDQLVPMGVSAGRLISKGWGENKPVIVNNTAEGKAANRRVEYVKNQTGCRLLQSK
jgi:hypothetical protein